jgi:hypothetical protein
LLSELKDTDVRAEDRTDSRGGKMMGEDWNQQLALLLVALIMKPGGFSIMNLWGGLHCLLPQLVYVQQYTYLATVVWSGESKTVDRT